MLRHILVLVSGFCSAAPAASRGSAGCGAKAGGVEASPAPEKKEEVDGWFRPGSPVAFLFFSCTLPQQPAPVTENSDRNFFPLCGRLEPWNWGTAAPIALGGVGEALFRF